MPQVIFFGMFFKKVEKIYVELYFLKERFNKMEIEDSAKKIWKISTIVEPKGITGRKS